MLNFSATAVPDLAAPFRLPWPAERSVPQGIRSPWRRPAVNVALEEILRARVATAGGPGFFVCSRNAPAVIVGRNQDAQAERTRWARSRGVPVFRRTSGGGAVYHDDGNLNWSWIVPGGLADRDRLLGRILAVLRRLGVAAEEGPRGGVYVAGRKIGGTACAAGKGVLLFHGTLLVSTDLDELRATLAAHAPAYPERPPGSAARGGVASVPAELATLARLRPGLDVEALETALFAALARQGRPAAPADVLADAEWSALRRLSRDYARASWIFRRRPPAKPKRGLP